MVGPTIKVEGDRVDNNNKKKVGVLGAYNLSIIEITRELVTDSAHAGEFLMPPTGAGGEDKRQLCDDKSPRGDSWVEWDPAQSAGVSTDHTAADEIITLPIRLNRGALLRNVQCIDPAGNVDSMTPLCTSSGTQGALMVVTELTFAVDSDTHYAFQTNTAGTNAAAGDFLINWLRTPAIQQYYLADPNANYLTVVEVR